MNSTSYEFYEISKFLCIHTMAFISWANYDDKFIQVNSVTYTIDNNPNY